MAKLDGGIFSRPRGKTAGIVFGAARTRQGKVATARQLVPPSNPNTAGQQQQRNKFKECLEIVRKIGSDVYRSDWNRAVSQLAGFQSMMSILMNNMNGSFVLSPPSTTNLGTLHAPSTVEDGSPSASQVHVEFSTEDGDNGTSSDEATFIVIASDPASTPQARFVSATPSAETRSGGSLIENVGVSSEAFICAVYMKGAGAAEGLISPAKWVEVQSGS